jgi:hypothetical protein
VTVVPYQKPGAPASAGLSVEQCESADWAVESGDATRQPQRRWKGRARSTPPWRQRLI